MPVICLHWLKIIISDLSDTDNLFVDQKELPQASNHNSCSHGLRKIR